MELAEADAKLLSDDAGPEIRFGMAILIGFFGLFLGWAAVAPLDAAVVAPGVVVVAGNRQTVQHRNGGVISRIAVEEGQRVQRGDILIELSAPELVARKDAILSQVLDIQMERAQRLASEAGAATIEAPAEWAALPPEDSAIANAALARYRTEARSRRSALMRQSSHGGAIEARISGYQDEIAAINRQHRLLEDELAGVRSLAERGLMPLTRVRALERAQAELDGRRAALRAAIAGAMEDRAEQLSELDARLAQLAPQLAAARADLEGTRIRAPVTGLVVGLQANTVGGVLNAGEVVMEIVPEGQDLIVEARVRPEDAEELRQGLAGEVMITAFSGRNLPKVHGEVRRVSADRFVDERSGEGYFLVQMGVSRAELERLEHDASGPGQLRPGLPAHVVVPTRRRTALAYLLEPLNQSLWSGMREN